MACSYRSIKTPPVAPPSSTFSNTCLGGTTLNFNHNVGQLQVGDIIYVGIGPNNDDASDGFTLDYSIVFNPTANPVP